MKHSHTTKQCPKCDNIMTYSKHCGIHVCNECSYHYGLYRCYCGWGLAEGDKIEYW